MAGFFGIGGSNAAPTFSGGPNYSALGAQIQSMQGPAAVNYTPENNAYQAQNVTGTALPQYDVAREQANTQANQNEDQTQDAISRKYASMGMANSGAAVAEGQVNSQQNAQQKADANLSIGAQEAQTETGLQSTQQQEAYESQEAQSARNSTNQLQSSEFNTGQQQQFEQNQMGDELGMAGQEESQAESAYNSQMNAYTAKNTGGLLGAGGFLGTGLG